MSRGSDLESKVRFMDRDVIRALDQNRSATLHRQRS